MTPSPSHFDGKPLALLLIEAGENDNEDMAVTVGVAQYDGKQLVLDLGKDKPPFVIRDEWMSKIKPVPEGVEEIFEGSEYYLPLTIGPLPTGIDLVESGYEATGLTWPFVTRMKGRNRRRR